MEYLIANDLHFREFVEGNSKFLCEPILDILDNSSALIESERHDIVSSLIFSSQPEENSRLQLAFRSRIAIVYC